MLTNALGAIVNNLFQENFDTTFIENEKNYQNINYFFFLKNIFFKWIINYYPMSIR